MEKLLRDLRWIVPASLGLGLVLSLLGPGTWWIGWLTYMLVIGLGLSALSALWRSAGSSQVIGLMLLLTMILRLGLGMAFSYILPAYGNDTPVQHAGYIFPDAYNRDTQAWELASSHDSLLKAFDRTYSIDQYGGLLFVSSLLYRFASPDAHRPWLIILLAALVGAIGVILVYRAARKAWGESVGLGIGWIMVLYPEAVLQGSSQMREPFLMTFVAMSFWGVVNWTENRRISLVWMAGGVIGLLLFNSGVAAAAIIILAIWFWLSRKERPIKWWVWAGALGLAVLAGLMFFLALRGGTPGKGGLLAGFLDWFRFSANYDASVLELNSGWLQTMLSFLPQPLHMPFIAAYGIAQPVLPAAIADPAVWPMRILGILRGLGWYALLPFLVFSLRPIWKVTDKRERLAWLWLWVASWAWIILSSTRAGGDQWDNPRYRVILLLFQAALAVYSLLWARQNRDHWLGRILAVEGVFLALFGYWYVSRYVIEGLRVYNILIILTAIVVISMVIIIGGWLWDRRQAKRV